MSVVALLFVVAEDLGHLVGVCCHHVPHPILLFDHELLHAVRVYLELLVAELVLSKILISRHRVIIKGLIRRF